LISVGDHINGLDEDIEKDIKIDVNGVNINAKDAKIKVDSNGVKIHSKESKVTIDKHGIHVDSQEK
jgi:hypothetical protein